MARDQREFLRHNTCRHTVVGPNTPIDQLPRHIQLIRAIEDLGRKPDHAASEAGEVLALRVEFRAASCAADMRRARDQDVFVLRVERAEEKVLFCFADGVGVQVAVLGIETVKEEMLFWEIFVERVRHAAHCEMLVLREIFARRTDADGEETGDLGAVLMLGQKVADASYSVVVFGIPCQLCETSEFKSQRAEFSTQALPISFLIHA